ncbi:MAG: DNA mismatch repair protein MutS [Eubacteriales bacterium]|nr:DNA mismatch repair protein MutS [Eubacteriales bacterium]
MPITPMMQQYIDIKNQYNDCIVFFRLGDFYEMFFEDAKTASKELEITLTGKDCGQDERAPMCGIPYHAADSYIAKLLNKGYKVAICEQTEDPSTAKGLVRRDVIRVVTPGTVTGNSMLEDDRNNYLMCIYKKGYRYGICVGDISTGLVRVTGIIWGNTRQKLIDETAKYSPSELLINNELGGDKKYVEYIKDKFNAYITILEDADFETENCEKKVREQFSDAIILDEVDNPGVNAAGAFLEYLGRTQKSELSHLQHIEHYNIEEYMVLDSSTRRNLELTETMRDKSRKGSLLWILDRTVTSMGARKLRSWIEQPLLKKHDILSRQEAVRELKEKFMIRMEIMEMLKAIYDIERLTARVVLGTANCRDLTALKRSAAQVPHIKTTIENCASDYLAQTNSKLDELTDIYELIERSISEDAPVTIKDGDIIKSGYSAEVDRLRDLKRNGRKWIASLESAERERTGIKKLRVGYNKVFGYFIEITNSNLNLVPENYIRKQTLVNAERYITPELKDMENEILGAQEKLITLEYEIFTDIRSKIAAEVKRLKMTAAALSELDALSSLAEAADREIYCRPEISEDDLILIKDGRHPVVEKMIGRENFVPNDTLIDLNENRLSVITGPNMAGKSTYMRQAALIVLMAQIGSFVPASSASIGIADRIFTRVGASDDLASGQSTFMVEMSEMANILDNATSNSLLLIDEVGRGTSTYDGLSIAWSVIEYICDRNRIGARTLFATHYHELTDLEGKIQGIKNYCITVEKKGDDIIFLRKIIRGGADDSYGIQVAKLAGLPEHVVERAKEILNELENADISKKESSLKRGKIPFEGQMELFAYNDIKTEKKANEIIRVIKETDLNNISPIEAMKLLYDLRKRAESK